MSALNSKRCVPGYQDLKLQHQVCSNVCLQSSVKTKYIKSKPALKHRFCKKQVVIVVDIEQEEKRRGIYLALGTKPE